MKVLPLNHLLCIINNGMGLMHRESFPVNGVLCTTAKVFSLESFAVYGIYIHACVICYISGVIYHRLDVCFLEKCQICTINNIQCVILPCGHAGICKLCADRLLQADLDVAHSSPKCTFCRQVISSIHRIYL